MTNGFSPQSNIVAGDNPMPEDEATRRFLQMLQGVGFGGMLAPLLSRLSLAKGRRAGVGSEDDPFGLFGGGGGTDPTGPTRPTTVAFNPNDHLGT